MARDDAERQGQLTTTVTVIQLQAELLRRQLDRRQAIPEPDRAWLEQGLATLVRASRELTLLLIDVSEESDLVDRAIPSMRLLAIDRFRPN